VSSAPLITAEWPWLFEITPTLSPLALGVVVGIVLESLPQLTLEIVITTPLSAASAAASVNSRRPSVLPSVM
jgi:hypothetical protein